MKIKLQPPHIIPLPTSISPSLPLKSHSSIPFPSIEKHLFLQLPYPFSHHRFRPSPHFNPHLFLNQLAIQQWEFKQNPLLYPFSPFNPLLFSYKKNLFRGFNVSYLNSYDFFLPYSLAPGSMQILSPSYTKSNKAQQKKFFFNLSKSKKNKPKFKSKHKLLNSQFNTSTLPTPTIPFIILLKPFFLQYLLKSIKRTFKFFKRINKSRSRPFIPLTHSSFNLHHFFFHPYSLFFSQYLNSYVSSSVTSFKSQDPQKGNLPVVAHVDHSTDPSYLNSKELKKVILLLKTQSKKIKQKFLPFQLKKSKLFLKKERNQYKHLFKNKKIILDLLLNQNQKIQLQDVLPTNSLPSKPRHHQSLLRFDLVLPSPDQLNQKTHTHYKTRKNSKLKSFNQNSTNLKSFNQNSTNLKSFNQNSTNLKSFNQNSTFYLLPYHTQKKLIKQKFIFLFKKIQPDSLPQTEYPLVSIPKPHQNLHKPLNQTQLKFERIQIPLINRKQQKPDQAQPKQKKTLSINRKQQNQKPYQAQPKPRNTIPSITRNQPNQKPYHQAHPKARTTLPSITRNQPNQKPYQQKPTTTLPSITRNQQKLSKTKDLMKPIHSNPSKLKSQTKDLVKRSSELINQVEPKIFNTTHKRSRPLDQALNQSKTFNANSKRTNKILKTKTTDSIIKTKEK